MDHDLEILKGEGGPLDDGPPDWDQIEDARQKDFERKEECSWDCSEW